MRSSPPESRAELQNPKVELLEVVKAKAKKKASKESISEKSEKVEVKPAVVADKPVVKEETMKITLVSARTLKAQAAAASPSSSTLSPKSIEPELKISQTDDKPETKETLPGPVPTKPTVVKEELEMVAEMEDDVASLADSLAVLGGGRKGKKARAKAKKKREKEILAETENKGDVEIDTKPVPHPSGPVLVEQPPAIDEEIVSVEPATPVKSSRRKRAKERDLNKKKKEAEALATANATETTTPSASKSPITEAFESISSPCKSSSQGRSTGNSGMDSTNVDFGHIIASIAAGFGTELKDILYDGDPSTVKTQFTLESTSGSSSAKITTRVEASGNVVLSVDGMEMKLDTSTIFNQVLQQLTASGMLKYENGSIQEGSLKVEEVWGLLNHLGKAMKMGLIPQVPSTSDIAAFATMTVSADLGSSAACDVDLDTFSGALGELNGKPIFGPLPPPIVISDETSETSLQDAVDFSSPPLSPLSDGPSESVADNLYETSIFLNQSSEYLAELVRSVKWMVSQGESLLNSPSLHMSESITEIMPESIYQSEPIKLGTSKYVNTLPPSNLDPNQHHVVDPTVPPLQDMIEQLERELAASRAQEKMLTNKLKQMVDRNKPWIKEFVGSLGIDPLKAEVMCRMPMVYGSCGFMSEEDLVDVD
jgi:hypothetical protein